MDANGALAGHRPRLAYVWYVTAILSLTHLVSLVDRHLLGVVLNDVERELRLTDTQLGLIYGTGFALLYSVVGLPIGQLADRVCRKRLIAAGLALWTLATIATAFVTGFWSFFLMRMLVGIGEASLVPAGMSLVTTLAPRTMLARATALFAAGGNQGKTVALLVGGPLLTVLTVAGGLTFMGHHWSAWRGVFLIASLPGLLLVPLLLTIREPTRAVVAARPSIRSVLVSMKPRLRAYVHLYGAFTAMATMVWALSAWALTLFVREHGLNAAQAGGLMGTLSLVVGPIGILTGGGLLDWLEARRVEGAAIVLVGLASAIAVVPTVMFCAAGSLALAAAGYAGLQLMLVVGSAPGWVGVQQITPPENRGVAMALFVATYTSVSIGIGPVIVGALSDHVFTGADGLGRALMTTLIAMALAGLLLALGGRRVYIRAAAAIRAVEVAG
ncbi:MFS transporter [Novosphingobium sp. H3SJ31-1]|uniref:MFS transporter n=1 Tax=Novosphingobium album (ex Liu et al. 2023) TaxID=3031130 RepID=A0ABT5WXC0_9SPHN|nr:MFS transporter [Novosphingobium album (ex Liu et al. 2023)]